MKLSIIIPVYNTEKYIAKCLESCMYQHTILNNEYEIIVVDDGSTDSSSTIATEVLSQYPNHKILKKTNGGLSSARNFGLNHANGDYIWFVDSDDWIDEHSIVKIESIINDFAPDIIMFNAGDMTSDYDFKCRMAFTNAGNLISGKQAFLNHDWKACAPFNIYKRNFLIENDLYFYEGIFHEDNEFTPRALISASKIFQINDALYYVRQTPGSITRTINPKRAYDIIKVAHSLDSFKNSNSFSSDINKRLSQFIAMCLNSALRLAIQFDRKEIVKFNRTCSCPYNRKLFKHFWESNYCKYMLEYFAFRMFNNPITAYKLFV